ncbi:hypothetical protein Amme1_00062 [Pseudomonas phage vB_PpuM-Amme-1]
MKPEYCDYCDLDTSSEELETVVEGKHTVFPVTGSKSKQFPDAQPVEVVAGLELSYRNWSIIRNSRNDVWEIFHPDTPDSTEDEYPRVWDCMRCIDKEIEDGRHLGDAITPETEDCVLRA